MNNDIPEVLSQKQDLSIQDIQNLIISLPNRPKAMLAKDLAVIYNTEPRRINEAVKRNPKRFPEDFVFQATEEETNVLVSQFATPKESTIKSRPYLFTHFGANQLSTVLHSDIAVERSVQIMRAFSQMEQAKVEPSQPQLPPPVEESKHITTFYNPVFTMQIKKKNIQDREVWRWVDFDASLMFLVKPDNTISMSEYQYNKALEMIGNELKSTLSAGFIAPAYFDKKEVSVEDVAMLPALPEQSDKFAQLETTQEMLQIRLSAATSQIEELKAMRIAEDAIKTKAQIGDKKVASALGKAGALAKKNKKLLKENELLKKQLEEKSIFEGVSKVNKFTM